MGFFSKLFGNEPDEEKKDEVADEMPDPASRREPAPDVFDRAAEALVPTEPFEASDTQISAPPAAPVSGDARAPRATLKGMQASVASSATEVSADDIAHRPTDRGFATAGVRSPSPNGGNATSSVEPTRSRGGPHATPVPAAALGGSAAGTRAPSASRPAVVVGRTKPITDNPPPATPAKAAVGSIGVGAPGTSPRSTERLSAARQDSSARAEMQTPARSPARSLIGGGPVAARSGVGGAAADTARRRTSAGMPAMEARPRSAETAAPATAAASGTAPVAPATGGGKSASGGGDLGVLDEVIDGLDSAFDGIMSGESVSAKSATTTDGTLDAGKDTEREVRALFAQIAANYMGQIRDFILELSLGPTPKEWLDITRPAVTSMKSAADSMRMTELAEALDVFRFAMDLAGEAAAHQIDGDERQEILKEYRVLATIMPDAFKLDTARDRREPIIVHSLLSQTPGVYRVTIDKVYRAGVTTLATFYTATRMDLAATAGIDPPLADAIVRRFQAYKSERDATSPEEIRFATFRKLKGLMEKIRKLQDDFRAAEESGDSEGKRRARRDRENAVLEVNVVLAQLGEVDLVTEIERMTFDRKVERLSEYVKKADAEIGA